MKEKKRDKFIEEAINKMMEIAGHSIRYNDLLKEEEPSNIEDAWYHRYTMTKEQYDEWEDWCVKKIAKVFKVNKKKARSDFSWFSLSFGLRIDPLPEEWK